MIGFRQQGRITLQEKGGQKREGERKQRILSERQI